MENREKLQLTTQMLSELDRMDARIQVLHSTVYTPIATQLASTGRLSPNLVEKVHTATAEFNTFKVVHENMLCETDIKAKRSLLVAS